MFLAASIVWKSTPLRALVTNSMWLVVVANVMTTRTAKNPENQPGSMPGNRDSR